MTSPPTGRPGEAGWLAAGRVAAPHGLDGSFHVAEASPALLELGAIVRVAGAERAVERRAGLDSRPIVRLAGIADRDAAAALRGELLFVSRTGAPALEPDEWWAEDLEGCAVYGAGHEIGRVRRLLALPSCEVLEVARAGDGGELLVPLVSDAVLTVDIAARRIEIDLAFLGESPDG